MQIYIYIFCNVRFVSFDITFFALKKICEYTYTHTHTRVTPLSSYLILATLTKAKCTLIGNYWTSVFFERKKILALTSTFLHPFTSSLSSSYIHLDRDACFAIFHLVSLIDQSSLL